VQRSCPRRHRALEFRCICFRTGRPKQKPLSYRESGRTSALTAYSVEVACAPENDDPHVDAERTRMMTAEQFRDTLSILEMTQQDFARHMGLGLRTVHGYTNGRPIPLQVVILARLLLGGAVSARDIDGVRQA
jgi:hypothetical protein